MFFRRAKVHQSTFSELIDGLKNFGFTVHPQGSGSAKVSKLGCAAMLTDKGQQHPEVGKAGIAVGDEIGLLVDGGFQKFFRTPTGKKKPATADELKALHDFDEDLRESLGEQSYYNESLGTVSTFYLYDRVKDRDAGAHKRVWE